MKRICLLGLGSLLLLSGCIELEERISINKNGSGYYETRYAFSEELSSMFQSGLEGAETESDLPLSQRELEKHFRGDGLEIVHSSFDMVDGRLTCEYRIEFQNATAFFDVPGMRKRFHFYQEDNKLVLRSVSQNDMSPVAGQPTFSVQPGAQEITAEEMGAMETAMAESMKALLRGLKISIMVELPNEIIDSNAMAIEGRMATWTVDESTLSAPENGNPFGDQIWASCSIDGLGFLPALDYTAATIAHSDEPEIEPTKTGPLTDSLEPEMDTPEPQLSPPTLSQPPPPIETASLNPQHPDQVTSGGRSLILLKNGRRMEVDGYYKQDDMLTLRRFGGTISLPVSIIEAVQNR